MHHISEDCTSGYSSNRNSGSEHQGFEGEKSLYSPHPTPSAFRTFVTRETRGTYAVTAFVTDPPAPILWELSPTTHTWYKHKRKYFKLILCCKDRVFLLKMQIF